MRTCGTRYLLLGALALALSADAQRPTCTPTSDWDCICTQQSKGSLNPWNAGANNCPAIDTISEKTCCTDVDNPPTVCSYSIPQFILQLGDGRCCEVVDQYAVPKQYQLLDQHHAPTGTLARSVMTRRSTQALSAASTTSWYPSTRSLRSKEEQTGFSCRRPGRGPGRGAGGGQDEGARRGSAWVLRSKEEQNPVEMPLRDGDEMFCNYCGAEYKVRITDDGSKEEQIGFRAGGQARDRVAGREGGGTRVPEGARRGCSPLLRVELSRAGREAGASLEPQTALTRG